jgi:endoglucanase
MDEDGSRGVVSRQTVLVAASAVLGLMLSGCLTMAQKATERTQDARTAPAAGTPEPDPTNGAAETVPIDRELWVDPQTPAARQVRAWVAEGRTAEAELLRQIADRPVAEWIGDDPEERTRSITRSAARAGRTPVLVAYHIPHRDCGHHSAGGAVDAAAYRAWIRRMAAGIGDRRAIVVLEPDAVAHAVDGCVPDDLRDERFALLNEAVATLAALPGTRVYLDAGHPAWIRDIRRLVRPLRHSGIAHADGFTLNVANFQPTRAVEHYGRRLSRALGGKPFVIDTSRNGNGPATDEPGAERWCNPPGRKLGEAPTIRTGREKVDAYLWIKRPGESDGVCNGGPRAGEWWPEYALDLVGKAEA